MLLHFYISLKTLVYHNCSVQFVVFFCCNSTDKTVTMISQLIPNYSKNNNRKKNYNVTKPSKYEKLVFIGYKQTVKHWPTIPEVLEYVDFI